MSARAGAWVSSAGMRMLHSKRPSRYTPATAPRSSAPSRIVAGHRPKRAGSDRPFRQTIVPTQVPAVSRTTAEPTTGGGTDGTSARRIAAATNHVAANGASVQRRMRSSAHGSAVPPRDEAWDDVDDDARESISTVGIQRKSQGEAGIIPRNAAGERYAANVVR